MSFTSIPAFFFRSCSMGDLRSLTRVWTWAPCSGSMESSPLDCQGSPFTSFPIDRIWQWKGSHGSYGRVLHGDLWNLKKKANRYLKSIVFNPIFSLAPCPNRYHILWILHSPYLLHPSLFLIPLCLSLALSCLNSCKKLLLTFLKSPMLYSIDRHIVL